MAAKRASSERRAPTKPTVAGRDTDHWKVVFSRWIRSGEHSSHAIGDVVTYWRHLPEVMRKCRDAGGSGKATTARLRAGVLMAWWDQAHGHLANRAQEMAHSSNRDTKEHDILMHSARLALGLLRTQPRLADNCDTWPEAGYRVRKLSSEARRTLDDTVPALDALLTWERREEQPRGAHERHKLRMIVSTQQVWFGGSEVQLTARPRAAFTFLLTLAQAARDGKQAAYRVIDTALMRDPSGELRASEPDRIQARAALREAFEAIGVDKTQFKALIQNRMSRGYQLNLAPEDISIED
jgi:hypothetical protein